MRAGRYVGRVGELAAILGVGVGLALAAPTAWADEASAGSSSESSTNSASAESASTDSASAGPVSSDEDAEERAAKHDDKDDDDDEDEDEDDEASASVDVVPVMSASEERAEESSGSDAGGTVASPMTWMVAAAARRELGADERTEIVTAEPENEAPSITDVSVGTPSRTTGTLTGRIVAADADGDSLRYSAASTATGTVSVNAFTGSFRYRPTAAARHAAAAVTDPVSQDTIVVTVEDRNGGVVSQSVIVPISPKNSAPILLASTRSPDASSGAVTTRLSGIDFDRDVLQYSAPTTTSKGAISLDPATRTLTYTPTDAARQAAAASGAPASAKTDTFTVTVADGHGGVTTKTVSVRISPKSTSGPSVGTGVRLVGDVTVPGYAEYQAYSAAGSHSVIVSDATDYASYYTTTKVIVVNNATARQVGSTLTLQGIASGPPLFNSSRTRAVVSTNAGGETRIAVINATTGAQIGSTLTYTDYPPPSLSPTGERAVFTSTIAGSPGVWVKVIDTSTGAQIGATAALDLPTGANRSVAWNANGTRALIAATEGDWDAGFTTFTQVIDAGTGATTANRPVIHGLLSGGPLFDAAGTRAVLITTGYDSSDRAITHVAGIDMVTGEQIGTTVTLAGVLDSALQTADRGRAVITTRPDNYPPQPNSSSVAVMDLSTGEQIGTTLELSGSVSAAALNSATTRAIITHQDLVDDGTAVTVVDTATGKQVGSTVTLDGYLSGYVSTFVITDGAYALVATNTGDATILNTLAGTATALTVTGAVRNFQLAGADGSRAVVTTWDEATNSVRVAVVETATGTQIGNTVQVAGDNGTPLVTDGRVLIAAVERHWFTGAERTRITTIDTTTGKQVGSTATLTGELYSTKLLSPTSSRALITVSVWNPLTYSATTKLSVFDTTTGNRTGSTISVSGEISVPPTFSPDGTRAVLTTANPVPFTGKTTGRVTVLRMI